MRKISFSSYALMYLGTLPFIFAASQSVMDFDVTWLPVSLEIIVTSYSLLIGSFMAGIHWGQHLSNQSAWPNQLAILSNIVTLGFWFSYLLFEIPTYLQISAALFAVILLMDLKLSSKAILDKKYILQRCIITIIVMGSLLTTSFNL